MSSTRVQDLPAIPNNTEVLVNTDGNHPTVGRTVSPAGISQLYIVQTPSGTIRRNQSHLIVRPNTPPNDIPTACNRNPIKTRTQTETPPDRLAWQGRRGVNCEHYVIST